VSVRQLNLVVLSTEIACCRNEVDVIIRIIVFLKLNWLELEAC
jgi:hypothetical protein